jgi:hypothetical protein
LLHWRAVLQADSRQTDHIYALKQNLLFFEVMLNHNHPVLIGLLRLAADATRNHNDRLFSRLYIVTLLFLACTACTGVFSSNAEVPHNGDREHHRNPDGTMATRYWFGIVIILVSIIIAIMLFMVRVAWKSVNAKRENATTR